MVMARQRICDRAALGIITTVGQAVQHAHARGVCTRSETDIMLGIDGRVMVMDFGLAKVVSAFAGAQCYRAIFGTPYGAGQASSAKDVSERADVFALGAMLFEMLTGEPHFRATGNMTVFTAWWIMSHPVLIE